MVPNGVPLMRASKMRSMSFTPLARTFFGNSCSDQARIGAAAGGQVAIAARLSTRAMRDSR